MKPTNKSGRPPKITLETMVTIGQKIAKGMTEEQACLAADVNIESFRTAKRRNPEFELAIKKEHANFLDRALTTIQVGREWTGLAWILERRHKPQFNRVEGHAVTDPQGGALLTDADMLELEKITKAEVKKNTKH